MVIDLLPAVLWQKQLLNLDNDDPGAQELKKTEKIPLSWGPKRTKYNLLITYAGQALGDPTVLTDGRSFHV